MNSKSHHYFVINPSPWPLISSCSSFNLVVSLLSFMKTGSTTLLVTNLLLTSTASFFWWFTYSGECNLEGKFSFQLEDGLKFSMILFISSEVFFFSSFFWSYFHFFFSPVLDLGLTWPPVSVQSFDCLNVPLINTLVLMFSGATVTVSHHYLLKGGKKFFNLFLLLTILMGVMFTFLQGQEYFSSFFSISDGTFGTAFFMLTGFHGIHVLIGTVFLFIILFRNMLVSSSISNFLSFELASWYWHFVDVVWLFLYFSLYYLNA